MTELLNSMQLTIVHDGYKTTSLAKEDIFHSMNSWKFSVVI